MPEEIELPPYYDKAMLRAAKALCGLGLNKEQLEAVLNVLNEVTQATYHMVVKEMTADAETAWLEEKFQLDNPPEPR